MPTLDQYINNGGYNRDKANGANLINYTPTSSGAPSGMSAPPSIPSGGGYTFDPNHVYSPNSPMPYSGKPPASVATPGMAAPAVASPGGSSGPVVPYPGMLTPGKMSGGAYTPPMPLAPAQQQMPDYGKMMADALAKQKAELESGWHTQIAQQQTQFGTIKNQYDALMQANQQRQAQEAQAAQQRQAQEAQATAARVAAEQAATQKKQGYIDTQTGLYNNYFTNQQNSQLAALKNARDTALQGFSGAERVANQTAYNNKNQVDASHAQSAQRLREIMASQGLLSSGDNVTQNLQLENQRANALNDINQSTGNIVQDVTEKRNMVNNQAASQEQTLADKISADKTAALIDLQKYGDQKETDLNKFNYQQYVDSINNGFRQQQADIGNKLQEGQLTGQYNGGQTLAAANAARQDALARAGLTGSLEGQQTLAGRGQAFDQSMGIADRTGQMGNGMKTLAAQQLDRQNKNDNISLAQWLTQTYGGQFDPKNDAGVAFDQAKGMQTLPQQQQALQNKQANLDASLKLGQQDGRSYDAKNDWGLIRDPNAPQNFQGMQEMFKQWLENQQLDVSKQNASTAASNATNSSANATASRNLAQAKFDYEKDPNNPANQFNNENKQSLIDSRNAARYKNIVDELDSSPYVQKEFDALGKPTGSIKATNPAGLEKYILNQGLSDSDARKLYARYGLKWGG